MGFFSEKEKPRVFSLSSASKVAFAQTFLKISSTGIDSDRIVVCKVAVLEAAVFLHENR